MTYMMKLVSAFKKQILKHPTVLFQKKLFKIIQDFHCVDVKNLLTDLTKEGFFFGKS